MVYEVKIKLHIGEYIITLKADNKAKLKEILRYIGFTNKDVIEIKKISNC